MWGERVCGCDIPVFLNVLFSWGKKGAGEWEDFFCRSGEMWSWLVWVSVPWWVFLPGLWHRGKEWRDASSAWVDGLAFLCFDVLILLSLSWKCWYFRFLLERQKPRLWFILSEDWYWVSMLLSVDGDCFAPTCFCSRPIQLGTHALSLCLATIPTINSASIPIEDPCRSTLWHHQRSPLPLEWLWATVLELTDKWDPHDTPEAGDNCELDRWESGCCHCRRPDRGPLRGRLWWATFGDWMVCHRHTYPEFCLQCPWLGNLLVGKM